MEELNHKFRFPLDIQHFAEGGDDGGGDGGDGGDGGNGAGNSNQEETVSKVLFDKKMSELSNLNKQIKAMQTDEQRAKAEKEETEKTIKELSDFKTKSTIENGLLKVSVSEKEAGDIANAIIEGDFENVSIAFGKALQALEKTKNDEIAALKLQIDEPNGASSAEHTVTAEEYKKMDLDARIDLKIKDPELYKQLSGK